jgi:hypothetical protein
MCVMRRQPDFLSILTQKTEKQHIQNENNQITLDCHCPRQIFNHCNLPDWPNFSLLSTFKKRNDITKEKDMVLCKYESGAYIHTLTWVARTTLENPRSSDRTFYKCILKHILIKYFRKDQDDHGTGGSHDANLEQRVQVGPCVSSTYPCWYSEASRVPVRFWSMLKDRYRYPLSTQRAGL